MNNSIYYSVKTVVVFVVVDGGIADWLTADHKANTETSINVILVESPTIPVIDVGDGIWPTMRSTLIVLGMSETNFIRVCDSSFKQGVK